jgi:hypothetical protein
VLYERTTTFQPPESNPHMPSKMQESKPIVAGPGPLTLSRKPSEDPLLENLYTLMRRSFLAGRSRGKTVEAYEGIARTWSQMCAEQWVQGAMFAKESELVRRFLRETGIPVKDPEGAVRRSLSAQGWTRIFGVVLEQLERKEFAAFCTVTGKQHLDAALATGRGVVIAHTHSLLGELFWTWLDHAGIDRGITLLQWAFTKTKEQAEDPKTRAIETARELRTCMDLLRTGGLVHAFGDGQDGRETIKIPVHNRLRPYRVGWATMAVSAKSPVITASVAVGAGGRVSIMIGPQISDDTPGLSDKQRVDSLVRAYAKHQEKLWLARPANITAYHMKQHLGFPPVA